MTDRPTLQTSIIERFGLTYARVDMWFGVWPQGTNAK
jgi:hypothetical protein